MRRTVLIIALLMVFSSLANAEGDRRFPLGSKMLKEQGVELPLPFGVSALFARMMDDTKITKFKLPLFGEIPGVNFKGSESETDAYHLKADLWLLPFMNIYAIGGYLEGESKTTVEIRGPGTTTPGLEFDIKENYHGTTYGIGTTLVYGIDNWVAALDICYTETELNVVDSDIKTLMITPRIGYSMRQYGLPVFVGFGVAYLDSEQDLTAEIPAQRARQDTTAQLHIANKKDWNTSLTAAFELDRHWQLVAEIGFYDRKSFVTQLTYRL